MKITHLIFSCLFLLNHVIAHGAPKKRSVSGAAVSSYYTGSPVDGVTVAGGNGQGSGANQVIFPQSISVDAGGNIYVADPSNNRIQKWAPGATAGVTVATAIAAIGIFVDPNGNIYASSDQSSVLKFAPGASAGVIVAGGHGNGFASNQLALPSGIFVDASNNVYIADRGNNRIQKWAPGAVMGVTVAGGNGVGSGPGQLWAPNDVFVDNIGNIYIADLNNSRVQKWAPGASSGTTIAGGEASGIFVDASGNVYFTDPYYNRVLELVVGATSLVTVAGGNGQGSDANQLYYPYDVYVDAAGNIFVADWINNRVQKFGLPSPEDAGSLAQGITVAGGNGNGNAANQFYGIQDVFVDAGGNVFVADGYNGRIQKWAPNATSGTTVAGGSFSDQVSPTGIFVDASGSIYAADIINHRVQKWLPGATTGITVAGGHGQGSAANQLNSPRGIYVDASGTVYVCDVENQRIQKWPTGATTGITVAGGNGQGSAANQFDAPWGIYVDAAGNCFIADNHNNRIQKWALGATAGITVAGGNGRGSSSYKLNGPGDLSVDATGNIYIADTYNSRIQKWAPGASRGVTVAGGNNEGTASNQLLNPLGLYVDPSGVIYVADGNERVQKFGSTQEITYNYYEGSYTSLPDFNALTPVKTGKTPNVHLTERTPGRNENYAFKWDGSINIPTAGAYTFEIVSDDGSDLYFNTPYSAGARPTVNNNGLHASQSAAATVNVTTAGTYPITVTYFQATGDASMQVFWTGPGIPRQLIPDIAFTANVGDVIPPSVPLDVNVISKGGNYISLKWGASTDNVGVIAYDVYVDDVKKYSTSEPAIIIDSLSLNTSYNITVKARDFAGNTSAASYPNIATTTDVSSGFTYKYYEGNWDKLPDFTKLTPVKTGYSLTTDINARNPGRNDNFAFVWEGYINITTPGSYTFETVSDDGSQLYFNSLYNPSATPTVNNDGLHGPASAVGTLNIPNAGVYPISITFFEKDGGEQMQVYWTPPGSFRQPLPISAVTQVPPPASGGLTYQYYEGEWNTLPDFTTLTPVKTGKINNISLYPPILRSNNFGIVWQGYINIIKPGKYTFGTVSDDGSKFYFNTLYNPLAHAVVDNDGLHAETAVDGTVDIPAAGVYPVAITFFQKADNLKIEAYWAGPGFVRQQIPDWAFVEPPQLSSGLSYKYYEGTWNMLPDFSALAPVKVGTSANVDISIRAAGRNDNFGFVWEGNIKIPAAGTYTFETISDDGSKLYFNSKYVASATATVSNDGLHAPTSATGSVYIPVAGTYPIAFSFFEKDGGETMQVYWSGPGFTRQPIPDAAFVTAASSVVNAVSNSAVITTTSTTVTAAGTNKPALINIYPDPFTDRISIAFNNTASTNDITVSINDLQGRKIYAYRAGRLAAGINTVTVPLDQAHLANGMYLVTLRVNGIAFKTTPLLKSKK